MAVINGDLFIQALPNTTKFLLLTDADWPIAEVYTRAEAEQLKNEHNQYFTLVEQWDRLLQASSRTIERLADLPRYLSINGMVTMGSIVEDCLEELRLAATIEQSAKNAGEGR